MHCFVPHKAYLTPFFKSNKLKSVHSINHHQPPISHDAQPIKKSNLITKAACKLKDINLDLVIMASINA